MMSSSLMMSRNLIMSSCLVSSSLTMSSCLTMSSSVMMSSRLTLSNSLLAQRLLSFGFWLQRIETSCSLGEDSEVRRPSVRMRPQSGQKRQLQ